MIHSAQPAALCGIRRRFPTLRPEGGGPTKRSDACLSIAISFCGPMGLEIHAVYTHWREPVAKNIGLKLAPRHALSCAMTYHTRADLACDKALVVDLIG